MVSLLWGVSVIVGGTEGWVTKRAWWWMLRGTGKEQRRPGWSALRSPGGFFQFGNPLKQLSFSEGSNSGFTMMLGDLKIPVEICFAFLPCSISFLQSSM